MKVRPRSGYRKDLKYTSKHLFLAKRMVDDLGVIVMLAYKVLISCKLRNSNRSCSGDYLGSHVSLSISEPCELEPVILLL